MEVTAKPAQSESKPMIRPIRYFYVVAGTLALIFVVIGFSGTYLIPVMSGTYDGTVLIHFHGAMFFLWLILCIGQPLLIQRHETAIHRKVGVYGFILAAMMVVMGVTVGLVAARTRNDPGFLLITLSDMVLFASFTAIAVLNRKNSPTHKRLIVLSLLALLPAAFGRMARMIGITSLNGPDALNGPDVVIAFLLQESILIIAVMHDVLSTKRVHPVYIWGGSALVLTHLFRGPLSSTETWHSIAGYLMALGS